MPNGRNAGRMFADCEGEYGYEQSHAVPQEAKEGDEVECHLCHRRFKLINGQLQPIEH